MLCCGLVAERELPASIRDFDDEALREMRAWQYYDFADSVFTLANNLFVPTFITELARQNGWSNPKSFWGYLSTVVTVASLLAFILFAPIAEYDGVKLPVFKWVATAGAVSCLLFVVVLVPEMIWLGAALFLVSKVASRVAGLMYDAMLHDVARGRMKAADEIANRAAALGYIGMILFFLIYVVLFFGGSFLAPDPLCSESNANATLSDGRICLPEGAKASSGSAPSALPLRPTNASAI